MLPVLVFVLLGRLVGSRLQPSALATNGFLRIGLPVFTVVIIVLSAVLSLVAIISIYREGGILKRLRATPLRPITIVTAHVLVKLLLTSTSLTAMVLAGRRFYPVDMDAPLLSFAVALGDRHDQPDVDGLFDREHRALGAIRAAARVADSLSDGRDFRPVRAARFAAADGTDGRASRCR